MAVTLGAPLKLEQLVQVARRGEAVVFSPEYCSRVRRARQLIEKAIGEDRVMYGVTTGFGSLSTRVIDKEEARQLQRNIVLSHSISVGEPFTREQARAAMLMVLQNVGQGYSGVRLEVLELLREMLNRDVTPWMPREGSVGYLAPEAHMALVLIGEGQAYYRGELMPGGAAMEKAGLAVMPLAAKEGLALIAIVGQGMCKKSGTAARLCSAISRAGVNLNMIDQGSSEMNIIISVRNEDYEKSIRSIYEEFVPA